MNRNTIWAIVSIIGLYVACQLIADVSATKLVQVGGIVLPGGSIIFAVTFTLRDMIHKRLGKEWARAAIVMAAAFNVILAAYMALMARMNYPEFFALGDAWGSIFAIVPAITIGSIVAELVSETIDTEIYQLWKDKLKKLPQWTRVLASNAVSIPVDSLVFSMLAFVLLPGLFGAESIGFMDAMKGIFSGQVVYKAIVTILSLPMIYLVKDNPII